MRSPRRACRGRPALASQPYRSSCDPAQAVTLRQEIRRTPKGHERPKRSSDVRSSDDTRREIQRAGAAAIGWDETRQALEAAELFWITTVRHDGRAHVAPLVAVWLDDAVH